MERQSPSFADLISDFGRESLGILPPDFGRDSLLGFVNINNSGTDRESLGIIQIDALREPLNFRRESLGFLSRESLNYGRESLGILHLNSFSGEETSVPDVFITTVEENNELFSNVLDTAFLQPYSKIFSMDSSSSSINPSFNSMSLEGPSRIYSASSIKSCKDAKPQIGNSATFTFPSSSVSSARSFLNKGRVFSPNELNVQRIQSAPVASQDMSFSFQEVLGLKKGDGSNEFQDSVFIEAHIVAEKIADGSILNNLSGKEIGVLELTPQPDWPVNLSNDNSKECQKSDTETVFKAVGKSLTQPVQDIVNTKSITNSSLPGKNEIQTGMENAEKTSQVNMEENGAGERNAINNSNTREPVSGLIHNTDISDVDECKSKNLPIAREDAKGMLQGLSELLNCTNHSEKQKSEGHSLLNDLADILCQDNSKSQSNLNDSGRSSINEYLDSPVKRGCEVSDTRSKSPQETHHDNTDALHCPLQSKRVESLKNERLSQSLHSLNSNTKLECNIKKINASTASFESNNTKNSSAGFKISKLPKPQIAGKLRLSHFSTTLKKGPIKPCTALGDIKKKDAPVTPERCKENMSEMQSKRTSTPISTEPKLKPVATSTPTIRPAREGFGSGKTSKNNSKQQLSRPFKDSTPPVTKTNKSSESNSFTRSRAYSSACFPKSSAINLESKLRRNSVSEAKKSEERADIKKRNSMKKIITPVARLGQNLGNAPQRPPLKQNSKTADNKEKQAENRNMRVTPNKVSFAKGTGKENVEK